MMNRKHTTIKTRKRQAGMTLLELTVVLLVLIGLSGLILPYAQGYLQRTHDGTGNDNLWELNNAMNLFVTKYMVYPTGMHSLIDGGGNVYSGLMNTSLVAPRSLTPMEKMSLKMAGITKVWNMKTSPTSATFDAVSALVNVTAANVTLAVVSQPTGAFSDTAHHLAFAFYNNSAKAGEFNTTCYDYVVFGIGPEAELVGKVISDAPVHFASAGGMGPDQKYNRFVVVFQVDKANGTVGTTDCGQDTERAKFIGSAMLMGQEHLWGLAHTHAHTYENMSSKNF